MKYHTSQEKRPAGVRQQSQSNPETGLWTVSPQNSPIWQFIKSNQVVSTAESVLGKKFRLNANRYYAVYRNNCERLWMIDRTGWLTFLFPVQ